MLERTNQGNRRRGAASAVLALHGIIHLIGFVVPWKLATFEGFPYATTALNGQVELGADGARILGLAWLVCAVGFVACSYAVWRRSRWAVPLTIVVAAASLVVCVLGLPAAVAGIPIDLGILAVAAYLLVRR
jgi:hypothetical protein